MGSSCIDGGLRTLNIPSAEKTPGPGAHAGGVVVRGLDHRGLTRPHVTESREAWDRRVLVLPRFDLLCSET